MTVASRLGALTNTMSNIISHLDYQGQDYPSPGRCLPLTYLTHLSGCRVDGRHTGHISCSVLPVSSSQPVERWVSYDRCMSPTPRALLVVPTTHHSAKCGGEVLSWIDLLYQLHYYKNSVMWYAQLESRHGPLLI